MSDTKEIVIDCTTGEPEEFKLNARGENGVYTTMVRGIPVSLSYTVTDYGPENRTEMDITFSIVCEKPPETTAPMVGAKEALQWFDNWGLTPETANKALQNYSALIFDITGGRLSKIGYDVAYIKRIADDYQTEICDECKNDMWISVNDILPENDDTVLIAHRDGVSFGRFNGRYWTRGAASNHSQIKTVTHWMPLPEPPPKE